MHASSWPSEHAVEVHEALAEQAERHQQPDARRARHGAFGRLTARLTRAHALVGLLMAADGEAELRVLNPLLSPGHGVQVCVKGVPSLCGCE